MNWTAVTLLMVWAVITTAFLESCNPYSSVSSWVPG